MTNAFIAGGAGSIGRRFLPSDYSITLNIFEDGEIVRDFIHVSGIAAAFQLLCEFERVLNKTIDIGFGRQEAILRVAQIMIDALGLTGNRLAISGQVRPGDIRHAVADTSDAKALFDWEPKVRLQEGMLELRDWARDTL